MSQKNNMSTNIEIKKILEIPWPSVWNESFGAQLWPDFFSRVASGFGTSRL